MTELDTFSVIYETSVSPRAFSQNDAENKKSRKSSSKIFTGNDDVHSAKTTSLQGIGKLPLLGSWLKIVI